MLCCGSQHNKKVAGNREKLPELKR